MNTNAVLTVFVLAATILAGSDVLKAEILTNFEIESNQAFPGQENRLQIMNTGFVQANNAIVLISANGTITDFTDLCAEGQVSRLDASTLVAKFPRMSPSMPCGFGLGVQEPVRVDVTISSDGRIVPWSETSSEYISARIMLILVLLAEIILLYDIMRTKYWASAWYAIEFYLRKKSFIGEEGEEANRTIDFVGKEYYSKIDAIDARVLKLIHRGKTAMGQLRRHSGLTRWQINYRLRKLRQLELVLHGKMELSETMREHFEDGRPKGDDDHELDPTKHRQ